MSIPEGWSKIKQRLRMDNFTLMYALIVAVVGISGFGLGRLSVESTRNQDQGIALTGIKDSLSASADQSEVSKSSPSLPAASNVQGEGNYLASKNGKLYYVRGCKAANRIKPENRVWFDTKEDAEKSGYSASSSCK